MNFKQVICKRKPNKILHYVSPEFPRSKSSNPHLFHHFLEISSFNHFRWTFHWSLFDCLFWYYLPKLYIIFYRKWNTFSVYRFFFHLWSYIKNNIKTLTLIHVNYFSDLLHIGNSTVVIFTWEGIHGHWLMKYFMYWNKGCEKQQNWTHRYRE